MWAKYGGYICVRLLLYVNGQDIKFSNTLYNMSNVDVRSSLRWLSASTMTYNDNISTSQVIMYHKI